MLRGHDGQAKAALFAVAVSAATLLPLAAVYAAEEAAPETPSQVEAATVAATEQEDDAATAEKDAVAQEEEAEAAAEDIAADGAEETAEDASAEDAVDTTEKESASTSKAAAAKGKTIKTASYADPVAKVGDTEYASLKEAVDAAVDGSTVTLSKDVTTLSELTAGSSKAIGVSGKSITIDGAGHTIARTSEYLGTVFAVANAEGSSLTLKNLTIDGKTSWTWSYSLEQYLNEIATRSYGYADFTITPTDRNCVAKASFITNAGSLAMDNVTACNIFSTGVTGALLNSTGKFTASDTSFTKIFAEKNHGGVINAQGGSVTLSKITAQDCGAALSQEYKTYHGGFAALTEVDLKVTDSNFKNVFVSGNSAVFDLKNIKSVSVSGTDFDSCVTGNDGGMSQIYSQKLNPTDFSFTNCHYSNMVGIAYRGQSIGGVLYVAGYPGYDATPAAFTSCTFDGNSNCAGAVFADSDAITVNFDECSFTGNKAGFDGGVLLLREAHVALNKCTAAGNSGESGGFAFFEADEDAGPSTAMEPQLVLSNTSVLGNKATSGQGGAIMAYGAGDSARASIVIGAGSELTGNYASNCGGAVSVTYASAYTNTEIRFAMEDGAKIYNNTAGEKGDDIRIVGTDVNKVILHLVDAESMDGKALADGADINGWYYDEATARFERYVSGEYTDAVGQDVAIVSELDLKAELGGYNVVFNGNADDVAGTTDSMEMKRDQEKDLTANGFSRTGYVFAGWNTEADSSGTSYADMQAVKNLADTDGATVTLYAQWDKINYTITYDPNGGSWDDGSTDSKSEVFPYDTDISIADAPTRDGYEFQYWEEPQCEPKDSYTVVENHTFKAVWKEKVATPEEPSDDEADDDDSSSADEVAKGSKSAVKADATTASDDSSDEEADGSAIPSTGDEGLMTALMALALAAGAGLTGTAFRRRKTNK